MKIPIVMVALEGTRKPNGKLVFAGRQRKDFPEIIEIEGKSFGFSEEEQLDNNGYCLGWYFSEGTS